MARPKFGSKAWRPDTDLVRALVAGWDADMIRAAALACEMAAPVLDVVDRSFPDPDKRAAIPRMQEAAATFRAANQARPWLETRDQ